MALIKDNKTQYIFNESDIKNTDDNIDCNINKSYLNVFPDWIWKYHKIVVLNVSYNNIKNIPKEVNKLINLEIIHLQYNKIETLPIEIFDLCKLTYINLNNNKLSKIPSEISKLKLLKTLIISRNPINELCNEFADLSNLKTLHFSETSIKKLIPLIKLNKLNDLALPSSEIIIDNNDILQMIDHCKLYMLWIIINMENRNNNIKILKKDDNLENLQYNNIKNIIYKKSKIFWRGRNSYIHQNDFDSVFYKEFINSSKNLERYNFVIKLFRFEFIKENQINYNDSKDINNYKNMVSSYYLVNFIQFKNYILKYADNILNNRVLYDIFEKYFLSINDIFNFTNKFLLGDYNIDEIYNYVIDIILEYETTNKINTVNIENFINKINNSIKLNFTEESSIDIVKYLKQIIADKDNKIYELENTIKQLKNDLEIEKIKVLEIRKLYMD